MKILLIEDDSDTAAYVEDGLRQQGHVVDHAATGLDGLSRASGGAYHVMVIDRMLPGVDGLTIVKKIRAAGIRAPVLLLTTLGGINDRVEGLEAGADDYLTKPFAFAELLARVNALARRLPPAEEETLLRVADLELNRLERTVTRGGKSIELQPQEFRLLEYLMRNAEQVVTRTMLLQNVWEFHFDPHTTVVETHISRLRAKIDRDFDEELIHTVRGSGYSLGLSR
ncbi:MAG: response regulator transcription factor [Betaproteobacteria bacterium]|nr:response regulator transcription factor [Betaproteobacteria bacterium]